MADGFLDRALGATQLGAGYKLATNSESRQKASENTGNVFDHLKSNPEDALPNVAGGKLLDKLF